MFFKRKIRKLTKEQELKIEEYRDRYFKMATCTEPVGDIDKLAKVARRITGSSSQETKIHFVYRLKEGQELHDCILKYDKDKLSELFGDHYWESPFKYEMTSKEHYQIWWEISKFEEANIRTLVRDKLLGDIKYTISHLLRNRIQEASNVAYHSYLIEVLNIPYSNEHIEFISLHRELVDSCYAYWFVGDHVIICERPKRFEIDSGYVVDIEWRNPND